MFKPNAFIRYSCTLAPAAFVLLAAECSSLRVTTDYSHGTNFSGIHTYSWLRVNAENSLWVDRIQRDVGGQLAARGWIAVPSGGQVSITAFSATRLQPSLQTFYSGFGPEFGGWYWGGWGGGGIATTQVVYTPIGSLVVDIFDNSTKHLIWRGTAQQVISRRPRKNEQKLARAVDRMFRNFPPQTMFERAGRADEKLRAAR